MGHPPVGPPQLPDLVKEAAHPLHEQGRGACVVVGQADVGEQVPIAGVQEQLCALDRFGELAGHVDVAQAT